MTPRNAATAGSRTTASALSACVVARGRPRTEDLAAPLRKILERRRDGSELLECGHAQPAKTRRATRRRCIECTRVATPETPAVVEELAAGIRCPFCRGSFDDPEELTKTCKRCRTKLHEECWEENGRCTTLGCVGAATSRPVAPAAPVRVVLSRQEAPAASTRPARQRRWWPIRAFLWASEVVDRAPLIFVILAAMLPRPASTVLLPAVALLVLVGWIRSGDGFWRRS